MSKVRNSDVCADCGAPEPRWASVNRCVLICDDCCTIHRGLGRHSSQVRHLSHTPWPPTLLQMVQTLYNNGASAIWEHTAMDPLAAQIGKRKGSLQERIHPNRGELIKAKYQMSAFSYHSTCREDDGVVARDLSEQLHSCVRTGNLETCLRLLSLGAQVNFFHPERGDTPLHVAAKAGQVSQAELLAVYGADPGSLDACHKTPIDRARESGHHELANRLVEIQYELTDRLAFYVLGRKPNHKSGQHYLIPQRTECSEGSEPANISKKKLQSLSNHLFEELAMDVYDEVDRRETDTVWLETHNHSTLLTESTLLPFLPVNPQYSSTRNQGRQKLARLNTQEFKTLIIDVLCDGMRREQSASIESSKENVEMSLAITADRPNSYNVMSDEDDPDSCGQGNWTKSMTTLEPLTFEEAKLALHVSDAKVQELIKFNRRLSNELKRMQAKAGHSCRSSGPAQ